MARFLKPLSSSHSIRINAYKLIYYYYYYLYLTLSLAK
jgi:hypothetical protein